MNSNILQSKLIERLKTYSNVWRLFMKKMSFLQLMGGNKHLNASGEKLSTNSELVVSFKQQNLRWVIDKLNLTNDHVYNAYQTGFFWKVLPENTLVRNALLDVSRTSTFWVELSTIIIRMLWWHQQFLKLASMILSFFS